MACSFLSQPNMTYRTNFAVSAGADMRERMRQLNERRAFIHAQHLKSSEISAVSPETDLSPTSVLPPKPKSAKSLLLRKRWKVAAKKAVSMDREKDDWLYLINQVVCNTVCAYVSMWKRNIVKFKIACQRVIHLCYLYTRYSAPGLWVCVTRLLDLLPVCSPHWRPAN